MTLSPALDAIRHFHQIIWEQAPHADRGMADDAAIAIALDKLASAYHQTPERLPGNTNWLPPHEDVDMLKERAMRHFPDYGDYVVVNPLASRSQTPSVGNALDDLVSISCELKEVMLRAKQLA